MESTADEAGRFDLLVVLARNVVVHRIVHNAHHSGHREIGTILGIIYEGSFCGYGIPNLVYQALNSCLASYSMRLKTAAFIPTANLTLTLPTPDTLPTPSSALSTPLQSSPSPNPPPAP